MHDSKISRVGQIQVYLGKCFRLFVAEKQWKNFLSTFLIIMIISLVTSQDMFREYKDTKNGAFAIICACIWIGLFNSIQSVCRERAIIKREHRTGLHISSYIFAHVIYEFALCMVETLIVLIVTLAKNHLHLPDGGLVLPMVVDLYLTLFFVTFGADMIALLISSIVKNENTAMTIMPFVLIIQLVMSGSVFELSGVSAMIANFTLSKWGLNGICAIANTNQQVYSQYNLARLEGCEPNAETLLFIWLLLLGFSLLYIFISIVMLKGVDKDER